MDIVDPNVDTSANETTTTTNDAGSPQGSLGGIDPNTLPDELRSVYDSMLGDYTRKTQELSAMRKATEDQLRLVQDPRALKAMAAAHDAMNAPPPSVGLEQLFPSFGKYKAEAANDLDDNARGPIESTAVHAVAKTFIEPFIPYIQALEGRLAQLEGRGVDQEWAKLVEAYPVAESLQPKVKAFMDQNRSVSLKQALFAVGGDELFAARRTQEQPKPRTPLSNPEDRRGASLIKPRLAASNGTTKVEDGEKSLAELGKQEIRANPSRYPSGWSR